MYSNTHIAWASLSPILSRFVHLLSRVGAHLERPSYVCRTIPTYEYRNENKKKLIIL